VCAKNKRPFPFWSTVIQILEARLKGLDVDIDNAFQSLCPGHGSTPVAGVYGSSDTDILAIIFSLPRLAGVTNAWCLQLGRTRCGTA